MARRHVLIIALLAAAGMVAGCNEKGEQKAAGAGGAAAAAHEAPVSVVTMKQQELPFTAKLPGRAVALQTAEIRPQAPQYPH